MLFYNLSHILNKVEQALGERGCVCVSEVCDVLCSITKSQVPLSASLLVSDWSADGTETKIISDIYISVDG